VIKEVGVRDVKTVGNLSPL